MVRANKGFSVDLMEVLTRDSIRILHVDDDNDFAELSARSLRHAGFNQPVVRCHDGLLAREHFSALERKSVPHVVLLDLHMPKMNGLELLRWFRLNFEPNVAVYLLTSSEDPEERKLAVQLGATEFLPKNLLAELIEKLDGLIAASNIRLPVEESRRQLA